MQKNKILIKIKEAIAEKEKVPLPSYKNYTPITFNNKTKKFIELINMVGAKVVLTKKQNILKDFSKIFPQKNYKILSDLEEIKGENFSKLQKAKDALNYDIVAISSQLAVAENGSFYIEPKSLEQRASLFLVESLVVLIEQKSIVNNMNEAYKKIQKAKSYGVFISGPSKTADIEQCLVFGASGPINLYIFIT